MRDGKALGEAKKAKKSVAERVASLRTATRIGRTIGFFVGTALFVVTALVVIGLGLPAWLVWAWAFVFWMRWQIKVAENLRVRRAEYSLMLGEYPGWKASGYLTRQEWEAQK